MREEIALPVPHTSLAVRGRRTRTSSRAGAGCESRIIEHAPRANAGNRQKTAKALDINRTTLFNKMRKYDLLEKY